MNEKKNRKIILDNNSIELKIKRLSYEIAENHYKTKNLLLCSIGESGLKIIDIFYNNISKIFGNKITKIHYNEENNTFFLNEEQFTDFKKASIILIDDVMNTGTSMGKCFASLVYYKVKIVEIAVLVNRHHTRYPMSPTYKGIELKTVIHNNIEYISNKNDKQVYLYDK